MTLALGGGRMILGKAARLHSQCRCSSILQYLLPPFSPFEASAAHGHHTHWRHFFRSVREVDVLLHPLVQHPLSSMHGSQLDAAHMPMDTQSSPASPFNPPALSPTYSGESPAISRSGHWNSETTGLPSGLHETGSPRVGLESLASMPSSVVTGATEALHNEVDRSSPFHHQDLRVGYCDVGTGGRTTMSSMPGGVEDRREEYIAESRLSVAYHYRNPNHCSPGVQPAAELNCLDGLIALDSQSSPVDTHAGQSAPGVMPSPEYHPVECELPCSPPSPTWNSPKIHTPQMNTYPSSEHIYPQSSALAAANRILPSPESVSTSKPADMDTGCVHLLPHGNQGLHHLPFPQPPPEVTTLLTIHSSGDVVSPVFARNSPLVPWELPSEIGHFWLGLFKISEVKVTHACHTVRHLI